MGSERQRIAIVLFNLGGPDKLEAVAPFLFNLFNDPAIIRLPFPMRWCLAKMISRRRAPLAREIYAHLGGSSPLLGNTLAQADALTKELNERFAERAEVKAFIAMRYWHPMTEAVVDAVKAFRPDEIILTPLYPQFSTTTTASSFKEWRRCAGKAGLTAATKAICCYPTEPAFIDAHASLIARALTPGTRVLFSAHGLPKKVIAAGDPYVWQIEQTASAVVATLQTRGHELDSVICYQSRVGPLEWVGPSTEEVLEQAGRDRAAIVLVPIAFVSEHSETLVELDVTYRKLALAAGVTSFVRVPALGTDNHFIEALASLVERAHGEVRRISAQTSDFRCPAGFVGCSMTNAETSK